MSRGVDKRSLCVTLATMPHETREAHDKRPKEPVSARIAASLYDAVKADLRRPGEPEITLTAWLERAVEEYLAKRGALPPCK